jgi:hypothetical protein
MDLSHPPSQQTRHPSMRSPNLAGSLRLRKRFSIFSSSGSRRAGTADSEGNALAVHAMFSAKRCAPTCTTICDRCSAAGGGALPRGNGMTLLGMPWTLPQLRLVESLPGPKSSRVR